MSLTDHGRVRKQQFHDRLGILHHRHLHRKLKERFPAAFNTRWTRRHWLHASLFATLGALLATIVPGFSSQLQPASQLHATLPLQLPPLTVRAPGEGAGRKPVRFAQFLIEGQGAAGQPRDKGANDKME